MSSLQCYNAGGMTDGRMMDSGTVNPSGPWPLLISLFLYRLLSARRVLTHSIDPTVLLLLLSEHNDIIIADV